MSELSYLEKLLDGVEVKWLPLGNVAEIYGGLTGKSKSDFENGNARYVSYKKIFGYLDVNDYPTDYVYISEGERQNKVRYGDVLFTGSSEIADEAGMSSAVTVHFDESVYLNSFSFGIRFSNSIKIKPEFAKYLFRTHFMRSEIAKTASGVTRFNISKSRFKKILVPIICPNDPEKSLAIQSEIVRILDKFTALTAELTAELNMRKKQYNYYRDQLLSFKEGEVEWKTLGDVTKKWYSGGTPTAGKIEYYENGNIPWLRTQEVKFSEIDSTEIKITQAALKNSSAKWIPRNCVIIAISGATAGRSAINKIPLTTNQHCGCLEIDDTKALYRYVFHWVSFNYENIKSLGQGARGDLNSTIIKNFKLPIPYASDPQKSLKEQARIVEILDKFDTLTNSITEGLPREIELCQKQYEYYRDLLFSFPKPDTVSN
ncbi:restriction endonuclease subunit S [Escherichia coli]|uniref:restriction endonuclease subunit S n=1 Tax=Escherichia coli TaxID=562 RepID=UPI0004D56FA7|nr:restriction endonuclease subunit S [Escherichia coli]KEM60679.1 type I restriction modification DNA specificity domain protein [Escherichia coli 7-233-03_S1_C2]KEN01731.1 type I restriction modification DNA specificity domain protein [Escherichia coli 7-233-03_S1_C3]